mmetsp:Transcript_60980/g.113157  ORF Transcript_60980/g.113157 Transcript_60980/m.113157 type:complete len:294 (-) Transcript_60980:122-1003(-)
MEQLSASRIGGSTETSSSSLLSPVLEPLRPLLPLLPGAVHSLSTVAIGHPFDTVKTRLQLQMHRSFRHCVQHAHNNGGMISLYRGAAMPLLQLLMKRPFEFYAWEWCNRRFSGMPGSSFYGGCVAGLLAAILGCPFSVVKIQMQSKAKETHPTVRSAVGAVLRGSGPAGLYRGLKASMITKVPFSTVYLGTYGSLREALPKSAWTPAAAGATASLLTWTLLQPLDTLQTIIQSTAEKTADKRGWIAHFQEVRSTGGVGALWAGWSPVALRALPTSAVAMFCYESARSWVAQAS